MTHTGLSVSVWAAALTAGTESQHQVTAEKLAVPGQTLSGFASCLCHSVDGSAVSPSLMPSVSFNECGPLGFSFVSAVCL